MDKYNTPKGYVSHTELLEGDQIDAVAEVLGHHLHHRLVMNSCYASRHLLVEKPMELSLGPCDDMISVVSSIRQFKLMVGQSQHFYGTSLKTKEILDSGGGC